MVKYWKVTNITRSVELADRGRVARSFLSRLVGLLNRSELTPGEALIIRPCNSIHTFFMRFPIDVLFLDSEGQVLDLRREMHPFRATWVVRGAKEVVELPAGTIAATGISSGDRIKIQTLCRDK